MSSRHRATRFVSTRPNQLPGVVIKLSHLIVLLLLPHLRVLGASVAKRDISPLRIPWPSRGTGTGQDTTASPHMRTWSQTTNQAWE